MTDKFIVGSGDQGKMLRAWHVPKAIGLKVCPKAGLRIFEEWFLGDIGTPRGKK